jgi:D-alanyl-D-alanine carboxypeptidase/D-alanyl-D-alanine-endopeptidase (penicillin-binding protein 4)
MLWPHCGQALTAAESALLAEAQLQPAQVGFVVLDAATGRPLVEHNADELFVPASVAKIPAVFAAAAILGPQHRFRTRLVLDSARPGAVGGALVLVGAGDPFLSSDHLGPLAAALAASGVARVARYGFDDSALPVFARIVADQPEGAGFNVGISALGVNFNRVLASLGGRNARAPSVLSVAEQSRVPTDWITFAARDGSNGPTDLRHQLRPNGEAWTYPAAAPPTQAVWLPVRNPSFNAAMVFRRVAAGAGVTLPIPQRLRSGPGQEIAAHESEPVLAIAREALRYSNNLTAELLGLAAARALGARADTLEAAAASLGAWLGQRIPGVDWRGLRLVNHSGLSGDSRASPRQIAAVLAGAQRGAFAPADIGGLMPALRVAPADRRARAETVREIEAKTGTMWFAQGMAGLAATRSGRVIAFCVFAVDWPQRHALDGLGAARPTVAPPGSGAWQVRTRNLMAQLARQWAGAY